MMRRSMLCIALAALTLSVAFSVPRAETLVYPLDEVLGDYPVIQPNGDPYFSRAQFIEYHGPVARVHAIRVIVSGEAETGIIYCEPLPGLLDTMVVNMDAYNSVRREGAYEYWIGGELVGGVFAITNEMHPLANNSFEYMHDGDVFRVNQGLGPTGSISECWTIAPLPWQEGRVDHAELHIDVTYPISTEVTTWGRIKALYP